MGDDERDRQYPGQAWLWLYTFWYQVPPFATSDNAAAQIWALMGILSLAFVCAPFIPGMRSIPLYVPVYRLIWQDYYRRSSAPAALPVRDEPRAALPSRVSVSLQTGSLLDDDRRSRAH